MATTDVPSVNIVHKVLSHDNYELWSCRVKTYLEAKDLWSVVTNEAPKKEDNELNLWSKKNAEALHAIHICCGDNLFPIVSGLETAKAAWDKLEIKFKSYTYQIIPHIPVNGWNADDDLHDEMQEIFMKWKFDDQDQRVEFYIEDVSESLVKDKRQKVREYGSLDNAKFIAHVESGDRDAIKTCLDSHPHILEASRSLYTGKTALHHEVQAGHGDVVKDLVDWVPKEDLEVQDINGMTALVTAVTLGNIEIAKYLVEKHEKLVTIKCHSNTTLPLLVACKAGKWDLARYLYSVTPRKALTEEQEGREGAQLISLSIYSRKEFGIALDLIQQCPTLTFAKDYSENSPLYVLARSAFKIEMQLASWQKWIYYIIGCFQGLINSKNLLRPLGINHIRKKKKFVEMLDLMCQHTHRLNLKQMQEGTVLQAMLQAVEQGNVVFLRKMCEANPILLRIVDKQQKSLFQFSIECRQEKVCRLLFELMSDDDRELIRSESDKFGNSILHTAGCLSSVTIAQLNHIQGAALQFQRELQWFQEVKRIVPRNIHDEVNYQDRMTALELFTKNHKEMVNEGEKQMKEIASSCTVVGALIVTTMFAAAFDLPPGTNRDKKFFTTFIISDSISLFSSTTSIVIFLGILTSRYAENDFLTSLPIKMVIGLSTLFLSIATMMIAFVYALVILHGTTSIIILVGVLASFPIISFAVMHFLLLFRLLISTFRGRIFH